MRRYFVLAFLFLLTLPFDLAVTGCTRNPAANFCSNLGYGQKNTAVASITLLPNTTGLSIPYGETGNTQAPSAKSCTNQSVSVAAYAWGIDDVPGPSQVADINPTTGQICAGSWNRTTNGGIAAYTTCLPTGNSGVRYVTASAQNVTSNTVAIYVHPQIANVQVVNTPVATSACPIASYANQCLSQGCTAQLQTIAYGAGSSVPLCAPAGTPGIPANTPDCGTALGYLDYTAVSPLVSTIDFTGLATANQPGSTKISVTTNTGNTSGGTTVSSSGYLSTCPAESISLTANGSSNPISVTPNNPQNITAVVTDVNNKVITGLSLSYASTQPQNVPISSAGTITAAFPSTASVTAICQPPGCNPAPLDQIGVNGNGTPIVSNPLLINSSGTSSTVLYMASPKSQYFSTIDFTIGGVSAPVKLPYFPNSMVLSPSGATIFFGSYRELMEVSTSNNTVSKEDTTVPGVVLAVSPDGNTALINDQNNQRFFIYTNSGSGTGATSAVTSTFAGLGQRAQFSSDGQTVYIVGNNTLYVHNVFTGWTTTPLAPGVGVNNNVQPATGVSNACAATLTGNDVPPSGLGSSADANTLYNRYCSPDLSVAVPTVGAFLSGTSSSAYGFCPDATKSPIVYYPPAGDLMTQTDHLTATTNSQHVIGASVAPSPTLIDWGIAVPGQVLGSNGLCPLSQPDPAKPPVSNPLTITTTGSTPQSLGAYGIATVDQVVASPDSSVAFVTYSSNATATPQGGALLPAYKIPASGTAGTLTGVPLSGTAISPLVGVFSPDTKTFYAATAGDNLVHLISTSSLSDTSTIPPGLPDANGNVTPVQFIAARPRSLP